MRYFRTSLFSIPSVFFFFIVLSAQLYVSAQSATVAVPDGQSNLNNTDFKQKRVVTENHFKLTAGISAQRISDDLSRSSRGRGSFDIEGERFLFPELSGFLSAGAYFASGSAASLFQNQDASYNYVNIARASLVYKPSKFGDLEAGILGRSFTTLPAAFKTDGFLGVSERLILGDDKNSYVALRAQQVLLPTDPDKNAPSQSKTPTLNTLGVEGQIKSGPITAALSGHFFAFSKLPASAAVKSQDYNSVSPPVGQASQYVYDFEGIQLGSSFGVEWSKRITTNLKSGYILNRKALDGHSQGFSTVLGAKINAGPNRVLKPELGLYYNESDVLPSIFVSNSYGNVNRRAYTAYLAVEFPEQDLSFYGRIVKAAEIWDRPYTADREIYLIGLEAFYDLL